MTFQDFEVEIREDEEAARNEVRDGDLGYLLLIPEGLESQAQSGPPVSLKLVYDEGLLGGSVVVAIERFLDQMNLELVGASARLILQPEGVVLSQGRSLIDFMLPGIALWGIMSNSIIGLAASMATYREKKILRRIKASPLKPRTFFAAQVLAYLVMSLGSSDCDPRSGRNGVSRPGRRKLADNRRAHTVLQHRLPEPWIHRWRILQDCGGGQRVRKRGGPAAGDVLRCVLSTGDAARLFCLR